MTTESELRELAERHGYKLVNIKRFKKHDRTHFETKDLKLSITWRGHIEDFEIKYNEERGFFGEKRRKEETLARLLQRKEKRR